MSTALVAQATSCVPARLVRRPTAARHGWASRRVELVVDHRGDLVFHTSEDLYTGIPVWRSRDTWLGALRTHPLLAVACRTHRIAIDTLLAVMAVMAEYADSSTGRRIGVSHGSAAKVLDVCPKTVQRACWAAEELGMLVRVLDGADMSLEMRTKIMGHYQRGNTRRNRSKLPNFYAATLPRAAASYVPPARPAPKPAHGHSQRRSVDIFAGLQPRKLGNVHPPVGGRLRSATNSPYSLRTTFNQTCGKPSTQGTTTHRTPAARSTTTHQKAAGSVSAAAALRRDRRWAKDLLGQMPGYWRLPVRRAANGLQKYARSGLSPSDAVNGLNSYLRSRGINWITHWSPGTEAQQARYLVGMINRAAAAGYLDPWPTPN